MFWRRYWPRQKLHVSVFIALLSVGIIVGVVASPFVTQAFSAVSWLVVVIILFVICLIHKRAWLVVIAISAGLLCGLWRGDSQLLKIEGYKPYLNQTVRLDGTIGEDVSEGKHGGKEVELGNIQVNGQRLPEKVWLSLHTKTALKRSDRLTLQGRLKPGFGNFAASMSFAKLTNHVKGTDAPRDVRDRFARAIRNSIAEPEASLGLGFLVGQRSSLPLELDQQLRIVGLTHIVVASGYNLTILVRLARKLLSGISKYLMAATSLGMIGGFILVTGLSPSMSRAGLVAVLSLGAWYYGRKISPFVLLPFAAAVTLLANPSFGWGDVGWYLSFAAFGGVMIVAPLMQHYFFGITKPGFVRKIFGETLAAVLVTAPIIMLVFGQYSVYALLANLLVVPAIPYIMLAVFAAGVTSWLVPFAAGLISLPAGGLLHYVTAVTQWIATFPAAQTDVSLSLVGFIAYYTVLIIAGTYVWFKTKHTFRDDNLIE